MKNKTYAYIESDYIEKFYTEFLRGENDGFTLDDLILDDFFYAIDNLFERKMYASSLKLMMIAIDTIAYTQYEDREKDSLNRH